MRRSGSGRRGAFVIHLGREWLVEQSAIRHRSVTLHANGEAVAMYGVREGVHARGDDGRAAEELWASLSARETSEAGSGAKTS